MPRSLEDPSVDVTGNGRKREVETSHAAASDRDDNPSRKKRGLPRRGSRVNVGAIETPFSGVGMEFEPLDGKQAEANFVLHEVGYWGNNYDWNFEAVFSPFWRICYDLKPGHFVRAGEHLTALGPHHMMVVPSFRRFSCLGDEPVPSLWMAFSLDRRVNAGQSIPILIPKNDVIAGFTKEFRSLFRGRRQDRREAIYQTGISFVQYTLAQPEIEWQAPLPERIAHVLGLIQHDPAASWTNAILARKARMNTDAFARLFRQCIEETPAKYVQRIRIQKACAMLAGSDLSIKQIAIQVGFANRHHFSRVFKSHTGISPARYRDDLSKH